MTDKNTGELNMISAGQKVNKLMQDFFTAYFNERDYKAAAGFLREDIRWIGLGAVCSARDRSEAVKFLQAEIAIAVILYGKLRRCMFHRQIWDRRQVIFSRQRSVWKRLPRSKAALTGKCWVCLTAVYQVVF